VAGISSFRRRWRARPRASGVALWSSARWPSSAVSGLPSGRIVERRDRRGEPIAQEQPAPPDAPRGQIAATCELVHGGARDAEQIGHLPGRQDICACQWARGWRSHLPKRGPEPPKRTPGGDFGWRLRALRDGGCSAGSTGTQPSGLLVSDCHAAGCRNHAEAEAPGSAPRRKPTRASQLSPALRADIDLFSGEANRIVMARDAGPNFDREWT
jgi:hypothetical protein